MTRKQHEKCNNFFKKNRKVRRFRRVFFSFFKFLSPKSTKKTAKNKKKSFFLNFNQLITNKMKFFFDIPMFFFDIFYLEIKNIVSLQKKNHH